MKENMSEKLITFYKEILALAGMTADKDGFISGSLGGAEKKVPVTLGGKRLVLPVSSQLRSDDWDNRIVFHPFYELAHRDESKVLEKLRNIINAQINLKIAGIATKLLELASSQAMHAQLSPDQSEFLLNMRHADDKLLDHFIDILDHLKPTDAKSNFLHFYLKRGGSVGGKKHGRVGVVKFPIYAQLVEGQHEIAGVTLRKSKGKDLDTLKHLFEYIFPRITEEEGYNYGSDSSVAPFMDAMLRTVLKVVSPLNDIVALFKNVIPELEAMETNCDWVVNLDRLNDFEMAIRAIPMQAGNEGAPIVRGVSPEADHAAAAPTATSSGGIPAALRMTQAQPVAYGMSQQQQQQQPAIVKTSGGTDYASLVRSNPALAQSLQATPSFTNSPQQSNLPAWRQGNSGGMGGGMGSSMQQQNWGGGGGQQFII